LGVCTERSERKQSDVTTTNPIYRCEELEDNASLYDIIVEEDESTADKQEKPNGVYLELISDETEEHFQGSEPPLPNQRPESKAVIQHRKYGGLKIEEADSVHVYLEILSDETPRTDAPSEDQDRDDEGLRDKHSVHVYFQSLNDESQGCDQCTSAENQVQDTGAQNQDTNSPEEDQEQDTVPED